MRIITNQLYHIYNQGNNKEQIFIERNDYITFLERFRKTVLNYCEIISYCLMPNHFHFMINTNSKSVEPVILGKVESTNLGNGFRSLCYGYAYDFNKKYNRTGSLFRQKTQAKNLETSTNDYPLICFNYIHQNPLRAKLCKKMEYWEFSSFKDYLGMRNGSFISKELAYSLLNINKETFYQDSYANIDLDVYNIIF